MLPLTDLDLSWCESLDVEALSGVLERCRGLTQVWPWILVQLINTERYMGRICLLRMMHGLHRRVDVEVERAGRTPH
eukprot:53629-Eustigmatos_ZCMA.PRE.1